MEKQTVILFLVAISVTVIISGTASADRSFQITMTLGNATSTVYIPGVGTTTGTSLTPATYTSPTLSHYYTCSYQNNLLTGLVNYLKTPYSVTVNRTTGSYSLSINQSINRSMVFAVFSTGDWKKIDNSMYHIESKTFLEKPKPSFSYGVGKLYDIKMYLSYDNIDFVGFRSIFNKGSRNMIINNNGTVTNKASIIVKDF